MATVVTISDEARAYADELVREGRYETLDQAVEAGVWGLQNEWDDEAVELNDLSPEDREAVEEGLADIAAGRTVPAEEVFDRLTAKYRAMANDH